MPEHSDELLAAVRELRDLVRLLAEPAIAERDKKLRAELRRLVGKSPKKRELYSLWTVSENKRTSNGKAA
jgi:hypothetical protein